jgi:formylglycine-generating enzyme required for sulfatase activity
MGWGGVVQTCTITNEFYIGVFELTQGQYKKIRAVGSTSYASKSDHYNPKFVGDELPVNRCSTHCIFDGITKTAKPTAGMLYNLNQRLGVGHYLTLPGQEQWICAFRAGTATYYCDGLAGGPPDDPSSDPRLDVLGRYAGNGGLTVVDEENVTSNGVVKVGSFRPNAYGLYDMLGNVYEVMIDQYHTQTSDQTGTPADSGSQNTAVLGGCWAETAAAWPFLITSKQLPYACATRDPEGRFGYRLVLWIDPGSGGDSE